MLEDAELWLRFICVWENMPPYYYRRLLVKTPSVDGVLLLAYRNMNNLKNP